MITRYSASLSKPVPLDKKKRIDEFAFFLQSIKLAITSAHHYKPKNCKKIKITGKIFFISIDENSAKERYVQPQEFEYSSTDDLLIKKAIESQVDVILNKKIPDSCVKIKMKFIICFYTK